MKHFPIMSYSVMRDDEYIDLSEVAVSGPCMVHLPRNQFFGGAESESYVSRVMESPTWGDIFIECIKGQQFTLDFHHSYLEGGTEKKLDSGVTLFTPFLGS